MTFWLDYCPSAELWLRTQVSQRLPRTCRSLECPVAFSVARASVASQSQWEAAGAPWEAVGRQLTPTSGASGRDSAAIEAAAFLSRAGTPCPFHTWLVLQMCVLHVMPSTAAGKVGPPKGVCAGRGREGMWLLAPRTQRQGQDRKGGKKKQGGEEGRKAVISGWKVIMDWFCSTCVLLGPTLTSFSYSMFWIFNLKKKLLSSTSSSSSFFP